MLSDAVGGRRGAALLDDGHALAVVRVAADGRVDDGFRWIDAAVHESEVLLLHRALLQLPREVDVGAVVLGDDEQAGGVLVQAVDDAGPEDAADARQVGAVGEQGVDQRMGGLAG